MSDRRPDVDVFTSVKAKELKLGRVPRTRVWFDGEPDHESETRQHRENLPDEVEPGVVYRDVKVEWRALSRIVHPTDEEV
ncbi:MAG TPA: hypothetical protein VFI17_00815 [Solirubrobacterales bacterium]|nr:hypothetical protein [Solirubrobacterales bacterium]